MSLGDESVRSAAYVFGVPPAGDAAGTVTYFLGGGSVPVRGRGPVEVQGASICDAANEVLGLALGVAHSCSVRVPATVSVFVEQEDAQLVLATFLAAVDRAGVTVGVEGDAIVLSGGRSGADTEGFGFPEPPGLPGSQPAGGQSFTLEATPESEELDVARSLVQLPESTFTAIGGRIAPSEAVDLLAAAGISAEVVTVKGTAYVVAPGDVSPMLDPILAGLDHAAVPVSSSGVTEAALEVIGETYPGVRFRVDEPGAVVWVSGPTRGVVQAAREFRRHILPAGDLRVDGAFVSVASSFMDGAELGATFSAVRGNVRLRSVVLPGGSAPLEVVVDRFRAASQGTVESRPSVTTRAGQEARFVSGQSVPILSRIVEDDDGDAQEVEYRDTGVVIVARPTPLPSGQVRLDVTVEVSAISGVGVAENPVFDTQSVSTSVDVQRGDVVVLSGLKALSSNRETRSELVLFGRERTVKMARELVFFVTVRDDGKAGFASK